MRRRLTGNRHEKQQRLPGDILFAIGSLFLAWYAFRLLGWGKTQASPIAATAAAR